MGLTLESLCRVQRCYRLLYAAIGATMLIAI
jgi:hypothetical protein